MTVTYIEIGKYIVGLPGEPGNGAASINCYSKDTGQCVITIKFVSGTGSLPPALYSAQTQSAVIYRPSLEYAWYLDLLRNEKPVYGTINTDDLSRCGIGSLFESVGDGE